MKVLKNWNEIGVSVNRLKEAGLPLHTDPVKCWDFNNIRELITTYVSSKEACIVDLGCGPSVYGCLTLELLRSMGYKNLLGIDIHIPPYSTVAAKLRGWAKYRTLKPYRMKKADIVATGLESGIVDFSILLSVVEHGVDITGLFHELNRIMKKGGIVYLSTDYWEEEIIHISDMVASGAFKNRKLHWTIFNRDSIQELIATAIAQGFRVIDEADIPRCEERPAFWNNIYYTFIAIEFEKVR
ncbi:MAG: methyltransferase domain-containing protein [Bacillota bacterium]